MSIKTTRTLQYSKLNGPEARWYLIDCRNFRRKEFNWVGCLLICMTYLDQIKFQSTWNLKAIKLPCWLFRNLRFWVISCIHDNLSAVRNISSNPMLSYFQIAAHSGRSTSELDQRHWINYEPFPLVINLVSFCSCLLQGGLVKITQDTQYRSNQRDAWVTSNLRVHWF